MGERISKYYPLWLELIPILLLSLAWFYTIDKYPLLPDIIPTHFDFFGLPDAWHDKSMLNVYAMLIIATVCWFSIFVLNYYLLIKPDDPQRLINVSAKRRAAMSKDQLEAIREQGIFLMVATNICLVFLFVELNFEIIRISLGLQSSLSIFFYLFLGTVLLIPGYFAVRIMRLSYG